ncbi:MAG: CHAD domain-containing protein [Magnetococcales bacterium]|nr:CHAD domain-containing protein [Magnetococcales bacterium]
MNGSSGAKKELVVQAHQTTAEAFQGILRHNLAGMTAWVEVADTGDDSEGVHQLRVATRRLRAALVLFRRAVPRAVSTPFRDDMRWFASILAAARELDVLLAEGVAAVVGRLASSGAGEARLRQIIHLRREEAYHQVREALRADRYTHFRSAFARWIEEQAWQRAELPAKCRKRLAQGIEIHARVVLEQRHIKLLQCGAATNREDPVALHRLRIECKKYRYALDFFASLFPDRKTLALLASSRQLQDALGMMNDGTQGVALLSRMVEGESDPAPIFHAGAVAGWYVCRHKETGSRLDALWEGLIKAEPAWLTRKERYRYVRLGEVSPRK